MTMTHYMELLAENQPWNLLLFMAIPIVLAETIAITELYILYTRDYGGLARALNRSCSVIVGFYFLGVFVYLMNQAVIPLSTSGGWRGPADMIAVGFYLAGVIPLFGLSLIELNVLAKGRSEHDKMALHASFVALFLIVGHIAMIFGMLDPSLMTGTVAPHAHH